MEQLNCRIGDLAVLIQGVLPKTSDSFVRIVGTYGYIYWEGFNEKVLVWKVELTSEGFLVFENDGVTELLREGPAPDAFLLIVPDLTSDALDSCLAKHPNLTREKAFQMARAYGFI